MPPRLCSLFMAFLVAGGATGFLKGARGVPAQRRTAEEAIACRVVESKTAVTLSVELIVFHHTEAAARQQLGPFLESHDGASVEFEIEGGSWQPATVFRLKNCFGRGLLAFPTARAHLVPGQTFLMRASAHSLQAE